ncbi:YfcC family protein [Pseudoduganella ginsengisoli]|uniref:Putative basic amino acid antiporter YfcC n=1 Tax=Pseudoduganella ginsengisoli TaxID=1462440 RepID=A0A6L6Q6J0_9BURK|nr:YfcC family protein [Pseudoduganella ginsengisoli]MTW05215.1 putative basic amino acid antiporter YfcC [Pseudoduganella ginsengisoli]
MKLPALRLPNTYVLIFSILALIALASWIMPGGRYDTRLVDGRTQIDPASFRNVPSVPQGLDALLMAPIKGFAEAAPIIAFVLVVGGAFGVLQKTGAIEAMIHAVARKHATSPLARALFLPLFITLFSLGGATFGMNEEAIPFVLIFVPLALALGYDSIVGVSIPFLGSQVGFAAAFLNPFNVGVAQGIAGVPLFSGMGYRLVVWFLATALTIAFLMWYAARVRRTPEYSPTFALDQSLRAGGMAALHGQQHAVLGARHRLVLALFAVSLAVMVAGVVRYGWFVEQIAALFMAMGIAAGLAARLDGDAIADAFLHGARDLVGTAIVIALARGTVVLARDAHIIDSALHAIAPLIQSSVPAFAAQKMFAIQSVINFFIHSGTGQAALTMPVMAPLADLAGISRQTAVLAFQFGEFTTPMIPTSGITVGVLALARIPWLTWARWMVPLQLGYAVLALALLAPPGYIGW